MRLLSGLQICKSKALTQYKLREKDLEGLHFWTKKYVRLILVHQVRSWRGRWRATSDCVHDRTTNSMGYNVTTHLYSELEVEKRAWERYGGPEAFETLCAFFFPVVHRRHLNDLRR